MPKKCSIKTCSRNRGPKFPSLSIFIFPKCKSQRQKWIDIIGVENLEQGVNELYICSSHFEESCLIKSSNKTKLREESVPSLYLQTRAPKSMMTIVGKQRDAQIKSKSDSLMVCRICFSIKNKLFCIKRYKLTDAFKQVSGLKINSDKGLPQSLCAECATKVQNFYKFRKSIQNSYTFLLRLQFEHKKLTEATFKNIDRKEIEGFDIKILEKTVKKDEYDLDIKHTDVHEDVKTETETEIKSESQENSDVELTLINNDNISDLDSEIDEKISITDYEISEKISITDYEISEKNGLLDDEITKQNSNTDDEIIVKNSITDDEIGDKNSNTDDEISDLNNEIGNAPQIETVDCANFDNDDDSPALVKKATVKKPQHPSEVKKETVKKPKRQPVVRKVPVKKPKCAPVDKETVKTKRKPYNTNILKMIKLDENMFTVTEMSYEEQIADLEKRKDTNKYIYASYKCEICYTGYSNKTDYDRHMFKHTTAAGKYQCKICQIYLQLGERLGGHRGCVHTHKYSCNKCNYVTKTKKGAKLHEHWHKGKIYLCPYCNMEFVKSSTYLTHVRIKHPSKHICQLCGCTYIGEKGLETHKLKAHQEDNLVVPEDGPVCEPCNVKFATEEAYQKHHSISHASKGGQRNKRNTFRKKTIGPISCEQCGILLADTSAYHGHFRRMHPDKNRTQYPAMRQPAMCDVCGQILECANAIKRHRLIHTDVRNFKCDHCDKEYFSKDKLAAHIRIAHDSPKNFGCPICGKKIKYKANIMRHVLIHSGQKPIKCGLCDKSFYLPSEKRTHIRHAHMKVPWPKKNKDNRKRQASSLSEPSEQKISKNKQPKRQKTCADSEPSEQELSADEQFTFEDIESEQIINEDEPKEEEICNDN